MNQPKTTSVQSSEPAVSARWLLRTMNILAALSIVLVPFHAFMTVWLSKYTGHYTELRLWKEALLGLLFVSSLVLLIVKPGPVNTDLRFREILRGRPWLIVGLSYAALCLLCGTIAYVAGTVTAKAFAYGLLADTRIVAFFCVTLLLSMHSPWLARHWKRLLLIPAVVVVIFGITQFSLLPANFLGHFGYGPATIPAVQTVDQKASYQRIQSTLRGANPLGAYLVVVLAGLGSLLISRNRHRKILAIYLMLSLAALAMTFSRSAWIGTFVALCLLLFMIARSARVSRVAPRNNVIAVAVIIVIAAASSGYLLRNNDVFQNTFLHTDENSLSATSSNSGHLAATKQGITDILAHPLGSGTGSAGPASVYNNGNTRISEDYYLQVGQETGLIGLGLFVAFVVLIAKALWQRRGDALPRTMLASLAGLSIVALFAHVWADDTLAYIWWGLAGIALGPVLS